MARHVYQRTFRLAAIGAICGSFIVVAGPVGGFAAGPASIDSDDAKAVALNHVAVNASTLGLEAGDVADLAVTDVVTLERSGARVVHLQQRFAGLDVAGGVMSVVVDADGNVLDTGNRFQAGLDINVEVARPSLTALGGVRSAAAAVGLSPTEPFRQVAESGLVDSSTTVSTGGVSADPIPARLVLQPNESTGAIELAWEAVIREIGGDNWWLVRVDADTGRELAEINFSSHATYNGYPAPTEAPSFGARTVTVDPADSLASPWGWHDTNGVAGAESNLTSGNNVTAYTDTDANNVIDVGSQPDGGASLVFDAPIDLAQAPSTYRNASVINAFQFTNRFHDVLYHYGFDEQSGNFQTNNYGRGGVANDAILVEVQDGSGVNNADFTTPPDGSAGRLQLMLFTAPTPDRDTALDNGVIAHELGHGVSNRLTGGPANVTCLQNQEQAGEGWSDYLAMMLTIEPGDTGAMPRPFGTYSLGQPPSGVGIRGVPYSTDMAVDPRTYDTIKSATIPHGVGSTFAAMLWDMSWALIQRDGFDPNWVGGTGGNITALQLVLDGMKLQPCSPGFIDARNAILLADSLNNAGANQCLIWTAFAKRGLGETAAQGSPTNRSDGTQAFDVPNRCLDINLVTAASPESVVPGGVVTYTATATNNSVNPISAVTVTGQIPAGSTYAAGSATCGGVAGVSSVSLVVGTLPPAQFGTCSYSVIVNQGPGSTIWLDDAFAAGTGQWVIGQSGGLPDWSFKAATGALSAAGSATASERRLTTATAVPVTGTKPTLRFRHLFATEFRADGGVVEVSTNGTTWSDVGPFFTRNGYTNQMSSASNPVGVRPGFTGSSLGFVESVVDLSSYVGSSIFVRFRLGNNATVASDGWWIDTVRLADEVLVVTDLAVTGAGGATDTTRHENFVLPAAGFGPVGLLRATTSPPVPSRISVDGVVRHDWGIDWLTMPVGNHEVCWTDVVGFVAPPCQIVTVIGGQTAVAEGSFTPLGLLQVGVAPAGLPVTVFVDGLARDEYGLFAFIESGTHQVCWGDVVLHQAPLCQSVVVAAGATTTVTGTFTPSALPSPGPAPGQGVTGFLRVTTSPAVAARIIVDGSARADWGLTWVKSSVGAHEICFSDVPGFMTPPCQTINVAASATTTVDGAYALLGLLQVAVAPAGLGVDVIVNGAPRNQFGVYMFMEPGISTICGAFKAGFTTPPCHLVAVGAGSQTNTTLTYTPTP